MKKLSAILATALVLVMVLAMLPMGAAAAAETVTFTFDFDEASTYKYDTTTAKEALDAAASASGYLTGVTSTDYVYPGHTAGTSTSCIPDVIDCLKFGKSKNGGILEMTFSKKVTKVELLAHEYQPYSASYPADTVAVNDGTPQAAPYTTDATFGTMTFELETASNTVKITTSERILVKSITVTFEEEAPIASSSSSEAASQPASSQTATTGTEDSDDTGDNTGIVSMTAVMVLAVTALAALVIGNKKKAY